MIEERGSGGEPAVGTPEPGGRRGLGAAGLVALALAIAVAAGVATWRARPPRAGPGATAAQAAAADANHRPAVAGPAPPGGRGVVSRQMTVVELTPPAQIQAEKFRCVCGCRMSLGECYCAKSPGSVDMKRHLQALVDAGATPAGIEKGMVDRYGPGVRP
ncbi:MAG TPA: hypothetical protein VE404_06510 [Verrucomicrobiae bacterium]|nr:hypothetical protein [Verrucomicrobiae bacterium]